MLSSVRLRHLALAATLFAGTAPCAFAEGPVVAKPQEAGFSSAGLARLDAYIKNEIAGNKIPGAMMIIQRNGRIAYATSLGVRDPDLDSTLRTEPQTTRDVYAAAIALDVLDGRTRVIERLRHLGATVVEAPPAQLGEHCVMPLG